MSLCFHYFQNLLNFTFSLKLPSDRQYGSKRANGSWTGIIGELVLQTADICKFYVFIAIFFSFTLLKANYLLAPAGLGVNHERSKAIDFSVPLNQEFFQFFVKNPEGAIYYHTFTEQFHHITWICIMIFCIILPSYLAITIQ